MARAAAFEVAPRDQELQSSAGRGRESSSTPDAAAEHGDGDYCIEGINVNVRSAFTVAFTFRSAFLALNAAANACERESMRGCARGVR